MFWLSIPTNETQRINVEFGKFCIPPGYFSELHPMEDMGIFEPQVQWRVHGFSAPMLSELALKS